MGKAVLFLWVATGVLACQAAPSTLATTPAVAARASANASPSSAPQPDTAAVCQEFSLAELEAAAPAEPAPDTRTFDVGELMRRSAAHNVATTRTVKLEDIPFSLRRMQGSQSPRLRGIGLGWQSLGRVDPLLGSDPAWDEPLQRWHDVGDRRMAAYHLLNLLEERLGRARATGETDSNLERCDEQQIAKVRAETERWSIAWGEAAQAIVTALEAQVARDARGDFLLAYFIDESVRFDDPEREMRLERPRELLTRVVAAGSSPAELVARAEELLARMQRGQGPELVVHLKRVLALTKDPGRRVETLIKLAALSDDGEKRELALQRVLPELERDPAQLWQLALHAGELSELQLERGAFREARESALRGASASRPTGSDGRADPWGIAPHLAETLLEIGPPAEKTLLPLGFLGPLSKALIEGARNRGDRALARQVAERLLRDLPTASEAPFALTTLGAVSTDAEERSRIEQRLGTDYGPGSPFWLAERIRRGTRRDREQLDGEMKALIAPAAPWPPAPKSDSQLREALLLAATRTADNCQAELASGAAGVSLSVSTGNEPPKVLVSGGGKAARDCLLRAAPSRFRSFAPVQVQVRLTPEQE